MSKMDVIMQAILPMDEKYRLMYTAYKACMDAGVEPPYEILKFFGHGIPNPEGQAISLEARHVSDGIPGYEVYEVSVADLPPGTKAVRVCVSY